MTVQESSRWGVPLVLTDVPHSHALDLDPHVGQRTGTFRFDLLDGRGDRPLGEVFPQSDHSPTLTHDTSRTVTRNISSVVFDPEDTALIDPVAHRVLVTMLVDGTGYPLGRYMFGDVTRFTSTGGVWSSCTLLDEMLLVDQELETAFSPVVYPGGAFNIETVSDSIRRLLRDLPVELQVDETPFFASGSWTAGTRRGSVLGDLALVGDYLTPYFGNDGRLHVVRAFDPARAATDFNWDEFDVVIRDSISDTSDLLEAPNRIIVISNDVGESDSEVANIPVVGRFDIPAAAPHSFFNRGFVVSRTYDMQVRSTAQASAVAANIGLRSTVTEKVKLSTTPDPRHDSYDVVRWRGISWLETAWSLVLREGGEMQHTLERTYT